MRRSSGCWRKLSQPLKQQRLALLAALRGQHSNPFAGPTLQHFASYPALAAKTSQGWGDLHE
jgi:hypothetical protein